jgi:RHS repeat-associated protein
VANSFFQGILDEPRIQGREWSAGNIGTAMLEFKQGGVYAYDKNGNRIAKAGPSGNTVYTFDSESRLVEVRDNNALKGRYVYNALGARVKKNSEEGTTLYVGKIFEQRPNGDFVNHVFANGTYLTDVVQGPASRIPYHIQTDHLGSAGLVLDSLGKSIQNIRYKPFGEIYLESGKSPVNNKYTGQEADAESELYFYNARYYDPSTANFISPDSLVISPNNPQNLNRYAYVKNSPMSFVDPDGHFAFAVVIIAAAIWGGTNGHPFESEAWQNFNYQNAALSAATAAAAYGAYQYGMANGFGVAGSSAFSGGVSGGLSGGLGTGGNAFWGAVNGIQSGGTAGLIGGTIATSAIFTTRTGIVQTPLASMLGSYASAYAMGGGKSEAEDAAKNSFWSQAFTNALGKGYDKVSGFKNGPSATAGSDKAYLMSRRLDTRFFGIKVPIVGQLLSVMGIGHLVITNGETTKELYPTGAHEFGIDSKQNSYSEFGSSFGTTYESLPVGYQEISVPSIDGGYNLLLNNSNTAIYNERGIE